MQVQFDPRIVPDPYAPLAAGPVDARGSFERQRARRAAILATTRRVLAQGPESFTLRRVADESGVTVQTLRNAFGRREELMVTAINEHTSAVWSALGGFSQGATLFLDLAEMYFHCAAATPQFLRAMVTSAVGSAQPLAVLQRHGSAIKLVHLRRLVREGSVRPGADIEALGAQITRLNTFMMYEWAAGGAAQELREQMVAGNRLLLMGAVSAAAAEQLEAWQMSEAA
ncbi:TetR/AcrR family transcriptional regulator [Novosphingobium sp. JCM 18896]|uniref:TetR/AcrR family transcriptional regulator n=1 Tax=Novosphingobium sp. JCM 18896 TaxID=2989731 RepID=UPI0022218E21|nr:TetR/AcrR family transcriptional regulator [Novosphingobium sp. JCM 18896]